MALTKYQKEHLDSLIEKSLARKVTEDNQVFNYKDLIDILSDEYSNFFTEIKNSTKNINTTLSSAISRIRMSRYAHIKLDYNTDYSFILISNNVIMLTNAPGMKKDKNRLYFDCLPENVYYDFSKGDFNESERVAKAKGYNPVFNSPDFRNMLKYEWIFNYINDMCLIRTLNYALGESALAKMPAGLYNEIKDYLDNASAIKDIMIDFYYKSKFGKFYKMIRTLCLNRSSCKTFIEYFFNQYSGDKLMMLCKNSLLNGEFYINETLSELFEDFYTIRTTIDEEYDIDFNRDITYNLELLETLKEKEKNAIIESNLRKLNFINDMITGDYIVKVPQTIIEKLEEGKMQNNCVGYYYDNSIMSGNDFIYFIRKKDNPEKSLVTCRYNALSKRTVEFKAKNNSPVNNNEVIDFINAIDEIIRNNLGA